MFCTQTLLSSSFFLFVTLLSNLLLKYLLLFFFYPALLAFLSWISTLPFAFIFFLPPVSVLLPLSCLSAPSLHHSPCSFSLNYCFYFSFNFRQGDTTWLQLTPYRAGGFPFAHSQPPAFAVVESISTMLLDSLPPSLYLCFCHCYFFAVYLYLFLQLSPLSGSSFLSLSMPLWASPGLVAVGSTRASHTVTWHAIYRPSEGVALSARRMLS